MILHVTFSDGSNPWVSLPTDRHTITKHWRRWMKNHPGTAQPIAWCGSYCCMPALDHKSYNVIFQTKNEWKGIKRYKHLGHALAALDRLGGERP